MWRSVHLPHQLRIPTAVPGTTTPITETHFMQHSELCRNRRGKRRTEAKSNRSLNIQCPDRILWTASTSITATASQTKNTSTYVYGCTLHMLLFTLYSFLVREYFYLHCSFLNTTLTFYSLQNTSKTASRTGVQLFHITIWWKYFSGHQLQNFPRILYS